MESHRVRIGLLDRTTGQDFWTGLLDHWGHSVVRMSASICMRGRSYGGELARQEQIHSVRVRVRVRVRVWVRVWVRVGVGVRVRVRVRVD